MQGVVVLLMAVSGVGCQNKGCDILPTSQTVSPISIQSAANVGLTTPSPSGHPAWNAGYDIADDYSSHSGGSLWRSTLYSFVFGHDPDVPTVREIEASLYSGGPGGY